MLMGGQHEFSASLLHTLRIPKDGYILAQFWYDNGMLAGAGRPNVGCAVHYSDVT